MKSEKKILITMGDPLGIGPEIIVKSLRKKKCLAKTKYLIFGIEQVFREIPNSDFIFRSKNIEFINIADIRGKRFTPYFSGKLAFEALQHAIEYLKRQKQVSSFSLVTAPISKENIKKAGFLFPGHTEYLCHEFGVKKYAMMLFHSQLKVVLATIHEPLKNVPALITKKLISEKLNIIEEELKTKFKIRNPRIAVCGLNPHAGENGMIGIEDKKMITPAIKNYIKKHPRSKIFGPIPADTVFFEAIHGKYDVVLCQYHDQGLGPLKTTGFYEGVNMTLGLPFVRTSPDHGTAFDIAGKNQADERSMVAAIMAAKGLQ